MCICGPVPLSVCENTRVGGWGGGGARRRPSGSRAASRNPAGVPACAPRRRALQRGPPPPHPPPPPPLRRADASPPANPTLCIPMPLSASCPATRGWLLVPAFQLAASRRRAERSIRARGRGRSRTASSNPPGCCVTKPKGRSKESKAEIPKLSISYESLRMRVWVAERVRVGPSMGEIKEKTKKDSVRATLAGE